MMGAIIFYENNLPVYLGETKPRFAAMNSHPSQLYLVSKEKHMLILPVANFGFGFPLIFAVQ